MTFQLEEIVREYYPSHNPEEMVAALGSFYVSEENVSVDIFEAMDRVAHELDHTKS
jgi:hypothetical protein